MQGFSGPLNSVVLEIQANEKPELKGNIKIMIIRQAALVGLIGVFFTATSNATAFFIDQFEIQRDQDRNPGVLQPWFMDNFDDGLEPPSSNGTFPNGVTGSYLTRPNPMPGLEENGKLRLETAEGEPRISQIGGIPLLVQRARLATNTSNEDAFLNFGLKETQVFTVTGTFDLIEPTIARENYGVRLTDFGKTDRNDNVQLRVILTPSGEWQVQFIEADFGLGVFDILDSVVLSNITGIGDYDQIALTLTKGSNSDKLISAAFELIDFEGSDLLVSLDDTAGIFDGERWTRAAFFAFAPMPIPATFLLVGGGVVGIGYRRRKKIKTA